MSNLTLERADQAISSLDRDGYALVRGVLSADDIARARAVCDAALAADAEAETEIEANALLQTPELNFMFDERVVEALTTWLGGTLAYYPNYIARINRFTDWHVDNGFFPMYLADPSHLFDPQFRHVQCVVYFQDNAPGPGGGLDVRPGSHRWVDHDRDPHLDSLLRSYPDVVSLDSKAGDLIVFNGRLVHRGTPADGSHELRKYGVFWSASRADPLQVSRYIDYFESRVEHLRTLNRTAEEFARDVRRHRLMHRVRFPDSYLPPSVEVIRRYGVTMAEMPRTA